MNAVLKMQSCRLYDSSNCSLLNLNLKNLPSLEDISIYDVSLFFLSIVRSTLKINAKGM